MYTSINCLDLNVRTRIKNGINATKKIKLISSPHWYNLEVDFQILIFSIKNDGTEGALYSNFKE